MDTNEMDALCASFNAHDHSDGAGYFHNTRIADIETHLKWANSMMDAHGIEGITLDGDVYPVALYVNMGDPYTTTIVYDVAEDTFYVSTWGDVQEEKEGERDFKGECQFCDNGCDICCKIGE